MSLNIEETLNQCKEKYEKLLAAPEHASDNICLASVIQEAFTHFFEMNIATVNPGNAEDMMLLTKKELRGLFCIRTIKAERNLDESDSATENPLDKHTPISQVFAIDKLFTLEICLDQEADFPDEANRSMDIEHIISTNPEYIRLRGSGLGQVLRLRGRKYKIVEIIPRNQYGLRFIFKKIQEKPEMFRGVVWMISTENIDDMIKQIKELTDNSERVKSLLASYNFGNNEAGLPIDAVAFGDYSRYIPAFKFLLYQEDEAFYAGQPIYENEEGQMYVPGLATLMLLSIMDHMDVLDAFKDQIIIPESYIAFFQEEYSKAASMDQSCLHVWHRNFKRTNRRTIQLV